VRETIAVTPDAVRAVAGDVRRLAGGLRAATAGTGAGACRVSGALGVSAAASHLATAASFDAMWLAWSTALDQVAAALETHARALHAAADGYGETDAGALSALPAGH
jgi:uncharacterized protein YukE